MGGVGGGRRWVIVGGMVRVGDGYWNYVGYEGGYGIVWVWLVIFVGKFVDLVGWVLVI